MPVTPQLSRGARRPRRATRLRIELLETRSLPNASTWSPLLFTLQDQEPTNDTLDGAQALGTLVGQLQAAGTIGRPDHPADVDWYQFILTRPTAVTLTALAPERGSALAPVLSLYNTDPYVVADMAYDPVLQRLVNDPYNVLGHRLLAQAAGSASAGASLDIALAPGTYFVAVSGAGNRHFHPFLADSGYAGATGGYRLLLTSDPRLDPAVAGATVVLGADPADGTELDRSPLLLRVRLNGDVIPEQIILDQTVRLTLNRKVPVGTGDPGDPEAEDVVVPLAWWNFSTADDRPYELRLAPFAPLEPGYYQLALAPEIAPAFAGFTSSFHIKGIEGGAEADDTYLSAHDLGRLTDGLLVQREGTIGDDPFYTVYYRDEFDLFPLPAADVDIYHFRIEGAGRFALTAEVFAGRIGSPLDAGLVLFRMADDGQGGRQPVLVAFNDNTDNSSKPAGWWTTPLASDPVLYAGLEAGEYYLAVTDSGGLPNPFFGLELGVPPVFNPVVSHSGELGFTTGDYVLNLMVREDATPPQVTGVSIATNAILNAPPTTVTVQFSEAVNLPQLAYAAFLEMGQTEVPAVYFQGYDPVLDQTIIYYPRLLSLDSTTNQAVFLMLDGLFNGDWEFHLVTSGPAGITDLAGHELAGGDFVLPFRVEGTARDPGEDPRLWQAQEPNNDLANPQVLGPLFPHELGAPRSPSLPAGVVVQRDFSGDTTGDHSDTVDAYQIEILQDRQYLVSLNGGARGAAIRVWNPSKGPLGDYEDSLDQGNGEQSGFIRIQLNPGTYVIMVDWTATTLSNPSYNLSIALGDNLDNANPLTAGPAPAIRLRLVTSVSPPLTTTPNTTPPGLSPSLPNTPLPVPQDILPPLAPGRDSGTAVVTGRLPTLGEIQASILLTRVADSVVGVRGATGPRAAAAAPLLVRGPESLLAEGLVGLAILASVDLSGVAAEEDAGDLTALVQESIRLLEQSCGQILDALFSMPSWLEGLLPLVPRPDGGADPVGTATGEDEAGDVPGGESETGLPDVPVGPTEDEAVLGDVRDAADLEGTAALAAGLSADAPMWQLAAAALGAWLAPAVRPDPRRAEPRGPRHAALR